MLVEQQISTSYKLIFKSCGKPKKNKNPQIFLLVFKVKYEKDLP